MALCVVVGLENWCVRFRKPKWVHSVEEQAAGQEQSLHEINTYVEE